MDSACYERGIVGGGRCVIRVEFGGRRARSNRDPRSAIPVCSELPTCEDGLLCALYLESCIATWCSNISLAFHHCCRTLLHDRVTRLETGSCVSFCCNSNCRLPALRSLSFDFPRRCDAIVLSKIRSS